MPPDVRYRDMCITGAPLEQSAFDPATGDVLSEDTTALGPSPGPNPGTGPAPSPNYVPEWTAFHQRFVGRVSGAKPPIGECMPVKDTPKLPINYNTFYTQQNSAFTHYMNMDNEPHTIGAQTDTYNASNYYRAQTFFIGGNDPSLNCPDIITLQDGYEFPDPEEPGAIPLRAEFERFKANKCYDYFILQRAFQPWFTMERPGASTDDPLSVFDPDRALINSCQPLINGISAKEITQAEWERSTGLDMPGDPRPALIEQQSGYAPVWRYKWRADMDEAEYLLSTYLQREWDRNFVHGVSNPHVPTKLKKKLEVEYPKISLPCIQDINTSGPPPGTTPIPKKPPKGGPPPPPPPPADNCQPAPGGPPPTPSPAPCEPPYRWIPNSLYLSPRVEQSYCPNVEKITEPSHPFSPRNVMVDNDITGAITAFFDDEYGHLTDRDYSWATTDCVYDCPTDTTRRGYTTYEPYDCETGQVIRTSPWVSRGPEGTTVNCTSDPDTPCIVDDIRRIRHPVVQCSIVPVDVLEFRDTAFNTCIMQRINYNYNDWMRRGYPNPDFWDPPCKTKFWETDTVENCPVKMSIQQCCHTIIKDVVPANFVKLRTCEGLMQNRRDDDELQELLAGVEPGELPDDIERIAYLAEGSCPPGFPGCSYTYTNGVPYQMVDGNGWTQNYLRYLTQEISEPAEDQCYTTGDTPNEPNEYMFSNYFGEFWYPQPDEEDPNEHTWEFVGYHMPYMRWWDTGASAGNPRHGGSYLNTLGGYDTLIGVGREERDYQTAEEMADADIYGSLAWFNEFYGVNVQDEGGSLVSRLGMEQPAQMGRIGGWAELKAHQMWSVRRSNLYCVARYEKVFKHGGPEDLALAKAGSGYTSMVHKQQPWSLGWRGYVSDSHESGWSYRFPNFPSGSAGVRYNLDNAKPGDIIVYQINGLSRIAYVVDWYFDKTQFQNSVFDHLTGYYMLGGEPLAPTGLAVVDWDQGKFPTSTGSTLNWGIGPRREIWKNRVPSDYQNFVCQGDFRALTDSDPLVYDCRGGFEAGECGPNDCQPSCADPYFSKCVLPNSSNDWQNAMVYRPYYVHTRQCPGYITFNPDGQFTLPDTYAWTGWSPNPTPPPPSPSVIYQYQSHQVGTDLWAWCTNSGYDPPPYWSREYSGARTGAITDATLCGPEWWSCSARPGANVQFFKGNYK